MSSTSMQRLTLITFTVCFRQTQTSGRLKTSLLSPLNTQHSCTSHIVLDLLMYVATIQRLNYSGQDSKKTQLAVSVSDIPVTLKQSKLVSWCLEPSQPLRITSGLIH